jgi:alpha-1,3-rhamnosyl/mannosyltransferase
MPEVAGDAAVRVDPYSVSSIADGIASVLHDEPVRGRLRAAGPARAAWFTWERSAEGTAAALRFGIEQAQ